MSKLGYFLGGALAGVIGTAIAAYAADACSSSGSGESQELETDERDVPMAEAVTEDEVSGKEEPCAA